MAVLLAHPDVPSVSFSAPSLAAHPHRQTLLDVASDNFIDTL